MYFVCWLKSSMSLSSFPQTNHWDNWIALKLSLLTLLSPKLSMMMPDIKLMSRVGTTIKKMRSKMNLPQFMLNLLFSDIAGTLIERNPPNPLFLYHWSTIVT